MYCEKPLTLTIEEGFRIRDAVKETGRVFQVGTQQRSEHESRVPQGDRDRAKRPAGQEGERVRGDRRRHGRRARFATTKPPEGLDWDMWVGPAQQADYSTERRKEFRWYYDYSGGKMTDWGAHHIDIAQWALGHDHTGPVKISGKGKFTPIVPDKFDWVAYFDGKATLPNGYHTPSQVRHRSANTPTARCSTCATSTSREDGKTKFDNGILFEGEEGRIFVDRETAHRQAGRGDDRGRQGEAHEQVVKLYGGKQPGDHMRNFFDCVEEPRHADLRRRDAPPHDDACHLCNIALMLGRELKWDPENEEVRGRRAGDDADVAAAARKVFVEGDDVRHD